MPFYWEFHFERRILMRKKLKTIGYIRLSSEKETSKSIENQQVVIEDFIADNNDLELTKLYIDRNLSGTTFERKQFEQMIADMDTEDIDCLVVCDLSRLGRNMISVGYYVENFFPSRGIRFISITDNFDSIDGVTNANTNIQSAAEMPLKALLDEQYSIDVKKKTNAALKSLMLEGKYIGSKPPYGYKRDKNNKHKLVVDGATAPIVAKIFAMASKGLGINEIVRCLNKNHIAAPSHHTESNSTWNSRTIKKILCNRTYTGDLEQGKDSILVLDTHEAIVDRNTFMEIQRSFMDNKAYTSTSSAPDNPLKGKVICGTCGGKMQRRRGSSKAEWYFYSCITNNRKGFGCDTGMYIRVSEIESAVAKYFGNNNIAANLEQVTEIRVYKDGTIKIS